MRQLLPNVLQPTENLLEAAGGGGKKFSDKLFKHIFSNILIFEKIYREISTYLAAPYRLAAAPKGSATDWKSTEAVGSERKKFSDKLWKNIFSNILFLEKKKSTEIQLT